VTTIRLESVEGGSSKFWQAEQVGSVLHIRWGRLGTDGQGQEKPFASVDAAGAALAKLVREKTAKGYASVAAEGGPSDRAATAPSAEPSAEPEAEGVTRLRYRIADFDADDETVFLVTDDASAEGAGVPIASSDLEGQAGVWILAQGTRLPAASAGWAPPVVLPRLAADALRSDGSCTLRTGWDEARELVLEQCELDDLALEEDQLTALRPWKKKNGLLCARSPEGAALVAANARVAQLLVLRVDDACCIEWMEGELAGARERAVAPKPAQQDKRSPAEIVLDRAVPHASRIKAARKLAKKSDRASFEALLRAQMGELEWKSQHDFATAASAVYSAARKGGTHLPLAQLLGQALERATEVEPAPEMLNQPPGPLAVAQSLIVRVVNRARDGVTDSEAEAVMRRFAGGKYGGATVRALEYFAERGDTGAVDALSRFLGLDASAAARALARLDPTEASRRYHEQLAALEASGQAHLVSNARSAMFSALEAAAGTWGAQRREWVALWESTADQPWHREKIAKIVGTS
jgi:predicted DNA-binding WGR domain protein